MGEHPVNHAVLRYQRDWDGVTMSGLGKETDGALTLALVPAPADGIAISLPAPFDADPSGIALGRTNDLYVCDTAGNAVIFTDEICGATARLPNRGESGNSLGQFNAPRGLLVGPPGGLYVADSGNARVQVFRLPTLELHAVWNGPLQNPVCLATDSSERVYVLDRGLKQVLRFSAWGVPDDAYNAAMAAQTSLPSPYALAVASDGTLYVSDDKSDAVLSFDSTGKYLAALPNPNLASPAKPRSLAAHGNWLYVADASSGWIWVYDCAGGAYAGTVANYRAPVSAMAVDPAGATLLVKAGGNETFYRLSTQAAYIPAGNLTAGPLDAGEGCEWERAHVQANVPAGTNVQLLTFVSDDPTKGPGTWQPAPALDILIPRSAVLANGKPARKRYLWLQVQLGSANPQATPTLLQVQAETIAESYLDHLPAVYHKQDLPSHFLERWLALFRSELGDLELLLEDMPRLFDPVTTPEENLAWLASWLAFEFPNGADAIRQRSLLARVHEFYKRRGTPSGIREFIELYSGAKAHIFEGFRERRIWQLGVTSALGFDTALAAIAPDGMIVGGLVPADPQYFGLQGDYYSDPNFENFVFSRTDPNIDFDWPSDTPDPSIKNPGKFSVRWTGQIQPRYSESYSFFIDSTDGARLWIDDGEIIDNWTNPSASEVFNKKSILLTAGRWYSIELEYYRSASVSQNRVGAFLGHASVPLRTPGVRLGLASAAQETASVHLSWSSRSQLKEIVPPSRLYSVLDDSVNLDVPPQTPGCGTLLVGQTIVGESGPLQASQFGMPLFSDAAHLFTVSVPAAQIPKPAQRQELKRIVEEEKPAHTDCHICFVEPLMRVGFQSSIGIDTIIGGPSEPMSLEGSLLGLDSVLGAEPGGTHLGRVGKRARLGQDTVLS